MAAAFLRAGAFFAPVFFAADLRAVVFFAPVFFAADLRAVVFFAPVFFAADLRAVVFFAPVFFAADLRAVVFFAPVFFAGDLRAVVFFAADFFAVDFLAADFFAVDFFAADFRAGAFFADAFFAGAFLAVAIVSVLSDGDVVARQRRRNFNHQRCFFPLGQAFPYARVFCARDSRARSRARIARDAVAMVLADGEYDCIVVDATDDEDGLHLELTITSGPEKGDVVRVLARGMTRDPIDLLALPARLSVRGGVPTVTLD